MSWFSSSMFNQENYVVSVNKGKKKPKKQRNILWQQCATCDKIKWVSKGILTCNSFMIGQHCAYKSQRLECNPLILQLDIPNLFFSQLQF